MTDLQTINNHLIAMAADIAEIKANTADLSNLREDVANLKTRWAVSVGLATAAGGVLSWSAENWDKLKQWMMT